MKVNVYYFTGDSGAIMLSIRREYLRKQEEILENSTHPYSQIALEIFRNIIKNVMEENPSKRELQDPVIIENQVVKETLLELDKKFFFDNQMPKEAVKYVINVLNLIFER